MDFFAVGSNRKDTIKGSINPLEGDKVLCDPGANECSSFLLECFNNGLTSDGFFSRFEDQEKAVIFTNGMNSTQFVPGVVRRFAEALECTTGSELSISHPPDSEGKRFVEVWKIPYPTLPLSPTVESSNVPVLVASDKFSLKPLIYPEVVQSIPIPEGTGDFLTVTPWEGLRLDFYGDRVIIFSSVAVIVLEWNGTDYDLILLHQTGTVYKASVKGNSAIVTYNDGTDKIAFYEKSGTWALSNTMAWSYTDRDILLDVDYIIVGGVRQEGIVLNKSTLAVHRTASSTNYINAMPVSMTKYPSTVFEQIGYFTWGRTLAGVGFQRDIAFSFFSLTGDGVNSRTAYLPPDETDNGVYSPVYLRQPYPGGGFGGEFNGIVLKTWYGELYPYDFLNQEYSASLDIGMPSGYGGYLFNDFLAGFYLPSAGGYRMLWAYGLQELIDLYPYDASVHKIYSGTFYPVHGGYYLTNNADGTLKLLRIGTTHYDEIGEGVVTLKFEGAENIGCTVGFTSGYNGLETCRFLISDDNVVFWKWNAPHWVVNIDPSTGNTESEFVEGCGAGFCPLNSKVVYVKVFLSSNSRDTAPSLNKSSVSLQVNFASRAGKAILCDDSRAIVSFESPTNVKITSLDSGLYALAGVVTLFAPPIDTNLDV